MGARPLRRHAAVRARRPAPRRAARLGHVRLRLRAHARCATSSSPTRCTGSRSSTSTACGSTPSPRCSTSTTRARTASGRPNIHGGRENLEAVSFLQEVNATAYKRLPRHRDDRRGVHRLAGRHPPDAPRRPRASASSGTWAGCTTRSTTCSEDPMHRQYHHNEMTFALMYAWSENYVPPDQPRRGRARQGLAACARCPATAGSSWRTCGRTSPSCGRIPASSCCSWARSSAQYAEWGESARRWTGGCSTTPTTAACSSCVADLNRVYRETPALWSLDNEPRGFEWIDANDSASNVFSFAALGRGRQRRGMRRQLRRRARTRATARPAPRRHAGPSSSTPTREAYGGSGVGNLGAVTATDEPWHGRPASATLRVPPLGALWLRPAPPPDPT